MNYDEVEITCILWFASKLNYFKNQNILNFLYKQKL